MTFLGRDKGYKKRRRNNHKSQHSSGIILEGYSEFQAFLVVKKIMNFGLISTGITKYRGLTAPSLNKN